MSSCILCPVYHPAGKPRLPHWPPVCDGCRRRLASDLADLPDLYALLPAVLVPGSSGESTRVSGSREAPVPPDLDVVDLLLPARPGSIGVALSGEWSRRGGDPLQVGHLSVATVLDFWVRDFRDARDRGERLPAPTVVTMAGWLSGERLRWACDSHPAIEEFAGDIRRLTYACRSALSVQRYVERLTAACPRCDAVALSRAIDPVKGADNWISCGYCANLWSEQEYARLATILVDEDGRAA